jgi:hypothetical protein
MREEFPKFFNNETGHAIVLRGILNQEDLTKAVVTSKVFVSPISVSTGLNTKNLLALSRGLPLVTTPLGAEGLLYASNPGERTIVCPASLQKVIDVIITIYLSISYILCR